MRFSLVNFLVGTDVFGHPVGVNYRGSGSFKTKVGALCSLAALVVVLANLTTLVKIFFDGSKQEEKV